jgi:hypothetical protein
VSSSSAAPLYQPLADFNEIRLLYLQPGSKGDKIECTMSHANLAEKPHYEALSYMWGRQIATVASEVNGVTCTMRSNLLSALTYLPHKMRVKILWVYTLCISQEDINERNHQVHQMGNIYQIAIKVVICSDCQTPHLLSLLKHCWKWTSAQN